MDIFKDLAVDWSVTVSNLVLLAVAFLFSLPVALNRERASRSAGLRTYPLVAISSCALMLLGLRVLDDTDAQARVIQGVITGMGFIGGGAILKHERRVAGLATAASLWTTAAMGIAVAWQSFEIALVLSVLMWATLALGPEAKRYVRHDPHPEEEDPEERT